MEKIDIVIPWLNPTEKWYSEYKKYCENEDPCRVRDLNTMKYVLRGIDKHCLWVNKVVLLMYDEEQVPEWINKDCPKLRIVYHKDFIPVEYLPNFNSCITSNFIHRIEGLTDIVCYMNDDMIFTKDIPLETYYKDGKAVHHPSYKKANWPIKPACPWHEIINTSFLFLRKITGDSFSIDTRHMPMPVDINTMKFIWTKYKNDMENSCKNARIRKPYSMTPEIFYAFNEKVKGCIFENVYDKIKTIPMWLSDKTTEEEIMKNLTTYHCVCLNDSEMLSKGDEMKSIITRCCKTILPNKCNFEK